MNINGSIVKETDFGIINRNVDVWYGELPFKRGDKFPTRAMQERADISNTNRLLYENEVDDVVNQILQTLPEMSPIYGYQLREIIARLPYNKTSVEYYTAMIAGLVPFIDTSDNVDAALSYVIDNSNLDKSILDETRSRFLDQFSVFKIYSYNGALKLQKIPSKNCVAFVNSKCTDEIEVVVVFNIYKTEFGNSVCEFIEYHTDGKVVKRVFNYNNGTLGKEIVDKRQEGIAFDGLSISPIIFCRHNTVNSGDVYGIDQFRYWNSSIVMAMRSLQNICRYGEYCREVIRQVPNNAIDKDTTTGRSLFINRGTITYNSESEQKPDIKYIQPDPDMMAALINEFDAAMDSVSNSTGLGKVFFGIEKAGSNLSAKSLEAMLYPAKLICTLIRNELNAFIKEACVKMCEIAKVGKISQSDISVSWRNSFPVDEVEHTEAVIRRYEAKLLSKTDAIVILNDVPLRIARQKAQELDGKVLSDGDDGNDSGNSDANKLDAVISDNINNSETNDVDTGAAFEESGASGVIVGGEHTNGDDLDNPNGPVWEYERPFM